MTAEKYSASMDAALLAEARASAESRGLTLSSWLADAVADRLRLNALDRIVTGWEAEHGTITTDELAALEQRVSDARRRSEARTAQAIGQSA